MNAHFLISPNCSTTEKSLAHDFCQLNRLVRQKLRILGSPRCSEDREKNNILFSTANKNFLCLKPVMSFKLLTKWSLVEGLSTSAVFLVFTQVPFHWLESEHDWPLTGILHVLSSLSQILFFFFQKCIEDVQFKILSAQVVSTVYCSASKVSCLRTKHDAPIRGSKPRLLDSEISATTEDVSATTEDVKDSKIHIISMKSFSIPRTMLLCYKWLNIWMKVITDEPCVF